MFWSITDEQGTIQLCERHALEATNEAVRRVGMPTFESMSEAALVLDTIYAVFGAGEDPFGFTTSEVGHCNACRHELEEFADEARTA